MDNDSIFQCIKFDQKRPLFGYIDYYLRMNECEI